MTLHDQASMSTTTATNGTNNAHNIIDAQATTDTPLPGGGDQDTQLKPSSPPRKSAATSSHPAGYPPFITPSTLPFPPFIDVPGVPNFRDLGGYIIPPSSPSESTSTVKIVRPNFLYRCAHPTQITTEGLTVLLATLSVKSIYDLRSGPEVKNSNANALAAASVLTSNPDPLTVDLPSLTPAFQNIRTFNPVYATQDGGPEALARKLKWYTSPSSPSQRLLPYPFSEGFVHAYREIAHHGAPAYRTMFTHILHRPTDPFLFHCTAGKDRTGVFAALVYRLAGLSDAVIGWEYALTEPGLGEWRRIFIERMTRPAGGPQLGAASAEIRDAAAHKAGGKTEAITRDEAARIGGSRAGNMRAWLTLVLDAELGGADGYLVDTLGFSREEVAQIKRNVVVEVDPSQIADGSVRVVDPETIVIHGWTADGGLEV